MTSRIKALLGNWSIPRQLAGQDSSSQAARSALSQELRPRLENADAIGTGICPYCAVGCAQLIYAKAGKVLHIEGDPRSPINQGTLCPKGSASRQLIQQPGRRLFERYG